MSFTVWFRGPHGSGKTTLSRHVAHELAQRGLPVELLDENDIQSALNIPPGHPDAAPDREAARLGWLCRTLNVHGVACVVAACSPGAKARERNRMLIGSYLEVLCSRNGGRAHGPSERPTADVRAGNGTIHGDAAMVVELLEGLGLAPGLPPISLGKPRDVDTAPLARAMA